MANLLDACAESLRFTPQFMTLRAHLVCGAIITRGSGGTCDARLGETEGRAWIQWH